MFQVGDQVRINSLAAPGRTGRIVGETRRFGQFRWIVRLDQPMGPLSTIRVPAASLDGIDVPERLQPGDRVVVIAGVLRNQTGTLVRPARLLWKKAWLVKFDAGGVGSSRVTERLLRRC